MAKVAPFIDGQALFQIGLEPLYVCDWLEVDAELTFYLQEKRKLRDRCLGEVFCHEPDSLAAQQVWYEKICDQLKTNHHDTHTFVDGGVVIAGEYFDLPSDAPPLLNASLLVQEDLLLLEKRQKGWFLSAGSLCFPSSWSLKEKFGKRLDVIHAAVPGFGPATRNAMMMARIFDNLKPSHPVRRANWSFYGDTDLYHPDPAFRQHALDKDGSNAVFRIEHQTLRKLPDCEAILFTVRIKRKTIDQLAGEKALIHRIVRSLDRLDSAQLKYKGLMEKRSILKRRLMQIAEDGR